MAAQPHSSLGLPESSWPRKALARVSGNDVSAIVVGRINLMRGTTDLG